MTFNEILAISGKPGLYVLKTKTRNGFLVTSLSDNKTSMVNLSNNVSVLNDISIYTYAGEEALPDVFQQMFEKAEGGKSPVGHKADKEELQDFFGEVLPEYDEDRVYVSDIRKVVQWYNLLVEADAMQSALAERKTQLSEEE
jgi:hypothetical protein